MLSVQNIFVNPKTTKYGVDAAKRRFAVFEGDHITLLNGKSLGDSDNPILT